MATFKISDIARSPALPKIGDKLKQFELREELGRGGMSVVFRAWDSVLDRDVAIKFVNPAVMAKADGTIVDRFIREVRLTARVRHPNLIQLYEASLDNGMLYAVTEFIAGETLDQRRKQGSIPVCEICRIGAEVASALEAAWMSEKVVHRDIKPGNVMLYGRDGVKVIDLGVAKAVSAIAESKQFSTGMGLAVGTPRYMAPEQQRGDKEIDFRVDVFALGAMLMELIAGRPPFPATSPIEIYNQKLAGSPIDLAACASGLRADTAAVIERMLAADPSDRPNSYAQVIAALRAGQAQTGVDEGERPVPAGDTAELTVLDTRIMPDAR